jgi:cytochrome c553
MSRRLRSCLWAACAASAVVGVSTGEPAVQASPAATLRLAATDSPAIGQDPLQQCAACHGSDGNSRDPQFPKLAGQDPDYLFAQLWAFRTGARPSDVMAPIAAKLSEDDATYAAWFYSRQVIRPERVKDKALAAAGERIFYAGDNAGLVSACVMCHGSAGQRGMPMMMGHMGMMGRGMTGHGMMGGMIMPNVPKLNGQRAAYLIEQLDRFADGRREGMIMPRVAGSLSEVDRRAVAEFLSGLR